MKNSDEVVDRLLKGLRTAQAPSGIESRILNAMESRTAPRNNWLLYATATACFSLAAMWFIATIKVPQPPLMPMYNPSLTAAEIPVGTTATKSKVRTGKHLPPDPAQLASFPAPPWPLTNQEKLLLRLAHQRDASNMSALNPAVHAAQIAKANEQFQKFFDIEDQEMRRQSE
jgi:hypothetical protein